MNGALMDPPRLQEHHDQANLAERIAGQAARDLADLDPLPEIVLARIGGRIQAPAPRRRPLWLGWGLVTGAFLLGIATAASAARLDLVPRWLADIVRGTPSPGERLASTKTHSGGSDRLPGRRAPATSEVAAPVEAAPVSASAGILPSVAQATSAGSAVVMAPSDRRSSFASSSPSPPIRATSTNDGWHGPARPKGPAAAMLAPSPEEPKRWPQEEERAPADAPATAALAVPAAPVADGPQLHAVGGTGPSASAPPQQRPTAGTSLAARPATQAEAAVAAPARAETAAGHLKQVVNALRVERSPGTALALLDRHAGELAGNAFAEEALLLRVEAMLALGERTQVLRLLDGMSLTDVAAARALLVTRGELRAAADRCAEAIGDFDFVLAEAPRPSKQALLGRARCKQRLGDEAAAQVDFDRYRREFGGRAPR